MLITPFDKCKYLKTDDAIINIINGPLNPDKTIKNKSCAFHNFDLDIFRYYYHCYIQ